MNNSEPDINLCNRKPIRCPKCGAKRVVKILYGYPAGELWEKVDRGEIVLGGCCVTDFDPKWRCVECGAQYYKESEIPPYCKGIINLK